MVKIKIKVLVILSCLLAAFFLLTSANSANAVVGVGSITPETLEATLQPGESVTETKSVTMAAWGLPGVTWSGNITLRICNETYADWLVSVSPEYITAVEPTDNVYVFNIEIRVPEGTPPGTYSFQLAVYPELGEFPWPDPWPGPTQQITIIVPPSFVIPIVPIGTIMLGIIMTVALIAYIKLPRK